MRTPALAIVLLAGLGCKSKPAEPAQHDDAPLPISDGPKLVDAPPVVACTPTAGSTITVRKVGQTASAMLVTAPPGDGRLFVLELNGAIRIFDRGSGQEQLRPTPFLDISVDAGGPVLAGGEQGLLGLAFHPNYATNRQFFVFYTENNPGSGSPFLNTIVRYTASATDPSLADPTSATPILSIPDPYSNHNGGMIEFGSDGFLYIGTGDGGSGGDPQRNGQNPNALLGKILRIDVDHPANNKPYGIPAGNPFAAGSGAPEVFMLGVRNPWRWSFDRANGDLWIGDVGQGKVEEINVLEAGHQAGANLGWSAFEGASCCATQADKCTQTGTQQACDTLGKTLPLDSRLSSAGWHAIIGGQVYRGSCYPDLTGWYFYTDNSKHQLIKARLKADKTLEIVDLPPPAGMTSWPSSPSSIHADARGELYMTTTAGAIWAIEAGP